MIHVAIVEDEELFADTLQAQLQEYADKKHVDMVIHRFSDGIEILDPYRPEWEIIFLDIAMTHMDGMTTARKIRHQDQDVILIFITSMAQYAIHGYEVDAQDYILKPVSYPQLEMRLDKALRRLERDREHYLILPAEQGKEKVPVREILYIEVRNHSLDIVTENGTYTIRGTLGDMEKSLSGQHFSRPSNSYLVNLRHVTKYGKDNVQVGTHGLTMSRTRKKQFLQDLSDYLGVEF